MSYFYIPAEQRVTQLAQATYDAWVAAANPKADYYQPIPDPPGPEFGWDGEQWIGPTVAAMRARALPTIDHDVDAVYATVIGQRGIEYQEAEADAQAYKDAGYTGTVPASLAAWVSASGMTPRAASDDILATAAAWRTAALAMRTQRLAAKAEVRAATTVEQVQAAAAAWRATINAIRAQLGLPPV